MEEKRSNQENPDLHRLPISMYKNTHHCQLQGSQRSSRFNNRLFNQPVGASSSTQRRLVGTQEIFVE